jgi:hypothetical protein
MYLSIRVMQVAIAEYQWITHYDVR